MMGGQQGGMMQSKAPVGQGQMMPDMMDMMNQIPGKMGCMSRQMNETAQAMARGQIAENHMRTMQGNMARMQNSPIAIERK